MFVPAVAAAIAGGIGVARVGETNGEAATVYAAHLHLPQFVHLIRHVDLVHSTYYAAMHVLVLLGGGVVAMRSVSLVATVLAAALIGLLGTRLTRSAVSGTLAGLAFALCPTVDGFAKTARSYGILPLLVVLTMLAFLRAVRSPGRRSAWLPYAAALLVAVYVHELSMLLIAAFAVSLLALRVPGRVWRQWVLASCAVLLIALPLVYLSHREKTAVAWIKPPGLGGLVTTARTYSGPSDVALTIFGIGALVAIILGLRGWRRPGGAAACDRRLLVVALPVAIVPALLLIAESSVALPLFDTRYVSYYQPAAALVVGHGLARLGRTIAGRTVRIATHRIPSSHALALGSAVVGAACVLTALVAQLPLQARLSTPLGYWQDYGAVVRQVEAHSRPGDGIAYLPPNLHYLPDGYPELRELDDFAQRKTPTHAGNFQGRSQPAAVVLGRLPALLRIWAVSKPGKSWRTPALELEYSGLRHYFRPARRWTDHGLVLTLWVNKNADGSGYRRLSLHT